MFKFLRKNSGWIAIIILTISPLIRWWFLLPLNFRFVGAGSIMTSLGQIFGLAGMMLFSLDLILTARLKIFDRFYSGLNNVYDQHHKIGAICFSLLLFHPLLLAVNFLSFSLRQAALFLLPGYNLAINYGIFSLGLMIILMVITFYIKLKYNHWKFSHKFMLAVFILAILHVMNISSDISRDNFLRYYILIIALVGLAAGFYQAFLSRYWNNNSKYKIFAIHHLTSQVLEIVMEPIGKPMNFEPGQFVFVRFFSHGISTESHPFSLSSKPGENKLKVIIKILGDYTASLKNLKVGDRLAINGPFGKFSYKNINNKKQIWLAGGIGITPFLSMASSLRKEDGYNIDLYYCVNNEQEAVLLAELKNIKSVNNNFNIILWCSDNLGRLNGQHIFEQSPDLTAKDIMLCGPNVFMENLGRQFLNMGVSSQRIHWEQFKFL